MCDALNNFNLDVYISSFEACTKDIDQFLLDNNTDSYVVTDDSSPKRLELNKLRMRLTSIENLARNLEADLQHRIYPSQEYLSDYTKLFSSLNYLIRNCKLKKLIEDSKKEFKI
jgi:hypothetical protein